MKPETLPFRRAAALFALAPLSIAQSLSGDAAWKVAEPPGPTLTAPIDVREGTWMNVDLSPDGKTLAFDLLGDVYVLPIEGGEARAIAKGVPWQMQPRFSPDGKRIAFTSDENGGDNLWVMDVDGANAAPVTQESFRLVNSPAWAPDGDWIAVRKHFTQRRSLGAGEIWLYHRSGGDGIALTTKKNEQKDLGEPAFSPDGRYVYYSYDATAGDTFQYSKDVNPGIYAIDRLDRTTGEVRTIASGPGGACRPTPSHDGKRLAFVRRVRYATTLFVQDLASGEALPVAQGLERDMQETWAIHGVYPTFAWTPDDKEIVYWARGKLWRVEIAPGAEKLAAPREIPFHVADERRVQPAVRFPIEVAPETFRTKALLDVAVSPRGDRVAYSALGSIWVRPLPDGAPVRLTQDDAHFEFMPSFSRDGSRIAFVRFSDDELGAVCIAPVAGGPVTVLTTEKGHYAAPAFSPDGKTVAYEKRAGGYLVSPLWSSDTGIYVAALAGGAARRVSRHGSKPQFAGSSDRLYLIESEESKDADVHRLFSVGIDPTADTDANAERVELESENAVEFALSPDGRFVAFVERFQVHVAALPPAGRKVKVAPKATALPTARVSRIAGDRVQFSGDGTRLYWTLGPELFERKLEDTFAFLANAPAPSNETTGKPADSGGKPLEPEERGRDIGFDHRTARPSGRLAFVGARIVTLEGADGGVIEDGTLVVDGDRIAAVGPRGSVAIPADARVFDVGGATLAPGIVDVHYHGPTDAGGIVPQQNWSHDANLAFGVTTAHDPSHDTDLFFATAELARAGRIRAPRLFSTGTILYGAMGSFKAEIETQDDAKRHLQRLRAFGAFSVKSYNQPRRDQRQKVLAAARELGMMVVPEGGSLLQHNLTMVVDGHTGIEHSLSAEHVYADVVALWKPGGVGYTPTLIVGYGGIWGENYWYDKTDVWKNERLNRFVPRFVLDPRSRRRVKAPDEEYNTLRSAGICKALVDAGASVQLGAHGQLAGLGAHWELWMLAEQGGLTPLEAWRAATLSGARYLGLDRDLGSLAPGKLADFLVLDANPLESIRNSERIRYTVAGGRVYDAGTLALLNAETPGARDGSRAGKPAHYFWSDAQDGLPLQTTTAGCASCDAGGHAGG